MNYRSYLLAAMAVSALTLSGCGKKPAPADISSMAPDDGSQSADGYETEDNGPGSQADLRRSAGADRVLFGYDSSSLDNEAQAILRRQAAWFAENPNKSITIEGHCDERGTRDYNIALGARRANAAKNYLASLGISVERMSTVSYGKERPEAVGSDEQSYAVNRRAVSIVVR